MFTIQDNDSSMCEFYYFFSFIGYMLAEKTLLDYTNLFSPKNYKKNDKISILKTNMSFLKSRLKTEMKQANIF